jgi:hypothetical protein
VVAVRLKSGLPGSDPVLIPSDAFLGSFHEHTGPDYEQVPALPGEQSPLQRAIVRGSSRSPACLHTAVR